MAASDRSRGRSRPPRARRVRVSHACCAPSTRRRRPRSRASRPSACDTSPRRSATSSAMTRSRRPSLRSARHVARRCPTSPTSADRSVVAGRSRSRRPDRTTCCSPGRRAQGRRCSARRLPSILPPLSREEALEVTRIHSVAGTLDPAAGLVDTPPFRAPHHGASAAAVVGGGSVPRPGEVSLAHRGVLLLDELPEFPRPVLEALRQPLEDGVVSVSRVGGRSLFPARFRLVATMNLCPCGGRGDPRLDCSCTPARVAAYRDKVSRALLDRFDLVVAMPRPQAEELAAGPSETSAAVRDRVLAGASRLARSTPASHGRRLGAPRSRRRPAAAERSRPSAGGPRRAHRRGARRLLRRPAGAHRGGALVSLTGGAVSPVTLRRLRRRDKSYPALLAQIPDPPPSLWLRGDADLDVLAAPAVAIVGARACSGYGRSVARMLATEAAAAGVVVVSGLARGIDGEAHRGALAAGGPTVAVLGCGVDRDYPAAHAELARSIVDDRRPDRLRVRAGGGACTVALPGTEPDHRRARSRDRRRRGARALGRAHHRGLRARGRPRGPRRTRRDHERLERRRERSAPPGRDAGDRARRTFSRRSASSVSPPRLRSRTWQARLRSSERSRTGRRPPTSSCVRPSCRRARSPRRWSSSSSPAWLRWRRGWCAVRSRGDAVLAGRARSRAAAWQRRPRRRRDRRRGHHGVRVRARARRGRPARPGRRRAPGRGGRERPQRRVRAPRHGRPLRPGRRGSRPGACARAVALDRGRARRAGTSRGRFLPSPRQPPARRRRGGARGPARRDRGAVGGRDRGRVDRRPGRPARGTLHGR